MQRHTAIFMLRHTVAQQFLRCVTPSRNVIFMLRHTVTPRYFRVASYRGS